MAEPIYDAMGNFTGMYADETPVQTAPATADPATSNTGTTQAGDPGTTNEFGIGIRPYNPLSAYSSYTYQISLWMITPDALEQFNLSGRKDITQFNGTGNEAAGAGVGGAYLVAQSGGINNPALRAPGFEYDYFIDNLRIESAVTDSATQSPTTNVSMDFTIVEQYGFRFITNLKRAKEALERYSNAANFKDSTNASRQFFVLGIKFLGYDAEGNLITKSPLANVPDPTFQRYYNINLTKVGFKIDGKSVIYNIKAASVELQAAFGQKRGVIDKGAPQLVGNTVEQILNQMMSKITSDQEADVEAKKREFANKYKITYLGDAESIAKSTIVSSADLSKIKWPMGTPTDKTTVNPSLAVKAQPNKNERTVSIAKDTPIAQAITSVITQSDYLVNGLKAVYVTDEQPDAKSETQEAEKVDSNKKLKWFNIAPVVSNIKFDTIIKDWTFDIEYQIRTYEIPVLKSAYADKTTKYYGAAKRYEYWWTGKNSEIIRYEQSLDNSYFSVALGAGDASSTATGGNAQVPIATSKVQPSDRLGKIGVGKEAQNSVTTDLNGGDWAKAKIEILGDPDWLANEVPTGTEIDKSFYGADGYSIDFKAGQVFVEIKFVEAVDYDNQTGLMEINQDVLFWDYPVSIAEKLQGAVSYKVVTIKHNFRGGKFTQELELSLNTFAEVKDEPTVLQQRERDRTSTEAAANNSRETENLASRYPPPVGLKAEPQVSSGTSAGLASPEELGENNG